MLQNSNNKLEILLLLLCLVVLFLSMAGCQESISKESIRVLQQDTSCTKLTDSVLNLADSFKERYRVHQETHKTSYNDLQRQFYNNRSLQEMTRQQLEDLVRKNEELAKVSAQLKDSVIYNISYKDTVIVNFKTVTIIDTIRKEVIVIIKKKKKRRPK